MEISVIAIGDELLIGQVVDTNSGSIARIIENVGWSIDSVQTVHDDADAILRAIDTAFSHTDIVVTTGGLGPTKDDITKQVLCGYFGGELVLDEEVLDNVKTVFDKRGLKLNALTESQAMVPSSCRVIQNRVGTAPIMWFEKTICGRRKILVSLPGVPFECVQMFESEVFPQLLDLYPSENHIGHRCVLLTGITESDAAEALDSFERGLPSYLHLAYLPKQGVIRLRLDGAHTDDSLLQSELDRYQAEIIATLPDKVLASADITPEEALLAKLRKRGLTLATAESCSGGNIAHRITSIAGCSDVYRGGVVSYANEVKINILGVSETTIATNGVVSEPVVEQMAAGACRAVGADCAVATSGIAGPGGATPGKPVGTVCIAAAVGGRVIAKTYHFPGTRDRVIDRASTAAITLLASML